MNNSFVPFETVIEAIRTEKFGSFSIQKDYFNLYWTHDEDAPELQDEVFVGEPSAVDDETPDDELDEALLPQPVRERGWWLCFAGDVLEDVISNATSQKPSATNEELRRAIIFYYERDTFMEMKG